MLMSEAELAMIDRLAERDGLARSQLLRTLVRREHEARFGSLPAAEATPARISKK